MTDSEKTPTVAVAGDEETVRVVKGALSDEDLRVEAVEPDDLRELDGGDEPDCVITDDGELLERIGGRDVPVVYVTGGALNAADAADAGAVEAVEPPLDDPEMFGRRVRRYAKAAHERQHAKQKTEAWKGKVGYEAYVDDPNILVGVLDTDGNLLYPNPLSLEYIDADPEAVVGKPFWETDWCDSSSEHLLME
ncbi:MAG: hypothetical protein ACLFR5_07595, partial [Halobacteriales archaeon]